MQGIAFDGSSLQLIDGLEVREPGPQDVLVEIAASGVCHSDLSVVNGTIPFPTPVVPGRVASGKNHPIRIRELELQDVFHGQQPIIFGSRHGGRREDECGLRHPLNFAGE